MFTKLVSKTIFLRRACRYGLRKLRTITLAKVKHAIIVVSLDEGVARLRLRPNLNLWLRLLHQIVKVIFHHHFAQICDCT